MTAQQNVRSFHKLHGLGNDFILFDALEHGDHTLDEPTIKHLCNRRRGIGGDGILLLRTGTDAPYYMKVWNTDGSSAETSGNGLRCAAHYLHQSNQASDTEFHIETASHVHPVQIHPSESNSLTVQVNMPPPSTVQSSGLHPSFLPESFRNNLDPDMDPSILEVQLENPHCVVFVSDPEDVDLPTVGSLLEHHPQFPEGTNVEFVQKQDTDQLRMRIWERGVGETPSCGSGTCAAIAASRFQQRPPSKNSIEVTMPGGTLQGSWNGSETPIRLKGPSNYVFSGTCNSQNF